MKNMRPLAPIERCLMVVVFAVPATLGVIAMMVLPPTPASGGGDVTLLGFANPVLFGLGAFAACRIGRHPIHRAVPAIVAAVGYLVAIWPWTIAVMLFGGAVGPCGGSGVTTKLMFIWLIVPSIAGGAALLSTTRSVLVGLSTLLAALAGTGAWPGIREYFGEEAGFFFVAELWIAVVLVSLFAWAFVERMKPRPSDGKCDGCGYDLSGNESGVCPECGAACSVGDAAARFQPHSGQPDAKSPRRS